MTSDRQADGVERYYLCVTCGRLNHGDRYEEGAATCNDCRADGRHDVNYREAEDGDGYVRVDGTCHCEICRAPTNDPTLTPDGHPRGPNLVTCEPCADHNAEECFAEDCDAEPVEAQVVIVDGGEHGTQALCETHAAMNDQPTMWRYDDELRADGGTPQDGVERWTGDVHQGDAAETLAEMPESSVHCVMTSPPYYGLRDYGAEGQIGLEESLEEYIQNLVDVGEELRRVLRPDGNWWLNLGDTYAGSQNGRSTDAETKETGLPTERPAPGDSASHRPKSKLLIPDRVAIALMDRGWVVRDDAIWYKTNGMPDPVKDRLREVKEHVFHLSPNPQYWFDLDAVRKPHADASIERSGRHDHAERGHPGPEQTLDPDQFAHPNGANPGDVFEGPVAQFPGAHFAVFPEWLVEDPIKCSCPPTVCAACGRPYEREVEEINLWERRRDEIDRPQAQRAMALFEASDLTVEHLEACRATGVKDTGQGKITQDGFNEERVETLASEAKKVLGGYVREFYGPARRDEGWEQACDCDTDDTEPGIVLDPFAGAGTTCLVAKRLGRRFVGIDLNEEFVAMAQRRVGIDVDQPQLLLEDEAQQLLPATDGGEASGKQDTGVSHGGGDDAA